MPAYNHGSSVIFPISLHRYATEREAGIDPFAGFSS